MDQDKAISPEWLELNGFARVTKESIDGWQHFPVVSFVDIENMYDPIENLIYLEKKLNRKQFCIVLIPTEYTDGSKFFSFDVFIQDDIGCGFTSIPNQFCEMTEYHFSLLYEAIRREKLIYNHETIC